MGQWPWEGQGGGWRPSCPGLPHCLDRDLAFSPAPDPDPPPPQLSDKMPGAQAWSRAVCLQGVTHPSEPLAPFSLRVLEGGWEMGEDSGHGRAGHGAGPGCYSLGFLLGETISGAGRGGCDFLVKI